MKKTELETNKILELCDVETKRIQLKSINDDRNYRRYKNLPQRPEGLENKDVLETIDKILVLEKRIREIGEASGVSVCEKKTNFNQRTKRVSSSERKKQSQTGEPPNALLARCSKES